jgi:hypothetical protein
MDVGETVLVEFAACICVRTGVLEGFAVGEAVKLLP